MASHARFPNDSKAYWGAEAERGKTARHPAQKLINPLLPDDRATSRASRKPKPDNRLALSRSICQRADRPRPSRQRRFVLRRARDTTNRRKPHFCDPHHIKHWRQRYSSAPWTACGIHCAWRRDPIARFASLARLNGEWPISCRKMPACDALEFCSAETIRLTCSRSIARSHALQHREIQ
jgi:hypothetical protein